ncbi:MAG: hypothetical protein HQ562_03610 [Candidatus Marinimicrobia bacterium]|nr:hypothetical protein [Candidatus Neomarinimicrobiota bacterium]
MIVLVLCILLSLGQAQTAGDLFYNLGFYSEAITEYKRSLFFCDNCDQNLINYKIAKCYYKNDQSQESEEILLKIINNSAENELVKNSLLFLGTIHWDKYYYDELRAALNKVIPLLDTTYVQDIEYLIAWTYIYEANWEQSKAVLQELEYPFVDNLIVDIINTKDVIQKSTMDARYLSIILPGAGQLYNRDYKNALFSFLLVGSIEASIVYDLVNKAYISALFKYLFLFTRYSKGSRYVMESKIARDNVSRMGDYLKTMAIKYPDPTKIFNDLISY